MQNELHTHDYSGRTTFDSGHLHEYCGTTSSVPDRIGHIHYMEGTTTLNDGHVHNYKVATSPAIYVNGGHYHYFGGTTSVAFIPNRHTHNFSEYTSIYMR